MISTYNNFFIALSVVFTIFIVLGSYFYYGKTSWKKIISNRHNESYYQISMKRLFILHFIQIILIAVFADMTQELSILTVFYIITMVSFMISLHEFIWKIKDLAESIINFIFFVFTANFAIWIFRLINEHIL